MRRKDYPSIDLVRQVFREENGKLFWLERDASTIDSGSSDYIARTNKRFAGKEAGCVSRTTNYGKVQERWVVRVNGIKLYRYQIIWAIRKGEWIDSKSLDHENRDSLDDRIENLRIATQHQQAGNCGKRSHNTTGYKGVSFDKNKNKYYAQMNVKDGNKRKHVFLGLFDDPEEAHEVYVKKAKEYFGEEFFHDGK